MDKALLSLLQSVDTPTVCNAIEVAQGKRGFSNFTHGTMLCSHPTAGSIVGYARTAQIAALNPPTEPADVIKERRMAYYKHMSTPHSQDESLPCIAVVEDLDFPDCVGAYWGEVNGYVHKAFGMVGAVTNGVMRDLGDMPDNFTVVAGSIGPSHGFVHVKSVAAGASLFGMQVNENDLVHADRHGALVIPSSVIGDLHAAIDKLLENEKIVLEPARQPRMSFEEFEKAWAAFEKART